jgi:hypothetical protein
MAVQGSFRADELALDGQHLETSLDRTMDQYWPLMEVQSGLGASIGPVQS